MEGWLQVPPGERNLIGRAQWKPRYLRFSNSLSGSRSSVSTTASSTRPTTSGSINQSGATSTTTTGATKSGLERSQSTHHVSALATAVAADAARQWTLAIYKQKADLEPIVRYPIQRIASCYIGDVAANKKKSPVLPTLVINLRGSDAPLHHSSSSSSSRTFRRRSNEVPSKDGSRGNGMGSTLLFRPHGDEPYCLERWSREIQSRLIQSPTTVTRSNTVDSTFRGGIEQNDDDPPSLFLINGEPNTAFLSPSIRSKNSNLSSIDSDDRSSLVSNSPSEILGSPRSGAEEHCPQSAMSEQIQPRQNLRGTYPRKRLDDMTAKSPEPAKGSGPVGTAPGRRETILDRFFSSTAPPNATSDNKPERKTMSSMARFEALMNELESARGGEITLENPPPLPKIPLERPRRIPSPTQRALEFVSTGRRRHSSSPTTQTEESEEQVSPFYTTLPTINALAPIPFEQSDSDNDTLHTTYTNSTTGTGSITAELPAAPLVPASQGKRHSLADFSIMRLATPPVFGGKDGGPRRGSYGDLAHLPEDVEDSADVSPVIENGVEFGRRPAHLNVERPLFREFSF
ncbi:hypothetical protein K440DRAFT_615857 [Wilcoxina mikolae CBS 423.85]|nr:hypothetical protein K440DRAFT_615857 [Wilcoxina mikolae CBS 423.85]